MKFFSKFFTRIILNSAALWAAVYFVKGFLLTGGIQSYIIGAIVLAVLTTFLRPILKIVTAPLIWITFGLFTFAIYGGMLWIADILLPQIAFTNLWAFILTSIILAFANAIV